MTWCSVRPDSAGSPLPGSIQRGKRMVSDRYEEEMGFPAVRGPNQRTQSHFLPARHHPAKLYRLIDRCIGSAPLRLSDRAFRELASPEFIRALIVLLAPDIIQNAPGKSVLWFSLEDLSNYLFRLIGSSGAHKAPREMDSGQA